MKTKMFNIKTTVGVPARSQEEAQVNFSKACEANGFFAWNAFEFVSDEELRGKELSLLEEFDGLLEPTAEDGGDD